MRLNVSFSAIITTTMLWSSVGSGQQLISTAGGYYTGNNITLSWSLGEPVIETYSNGSVVLTQGFQQPYFYSSQIINLPAGWSGISTYINPSGKAVEGMFNDVEPQMVILQSMTGMYWPAQGTNTIINWNYKEGYKIKMNAPATLEVTGLMAASKTVTVVTGWSMIPVLSQCVISTDLFSQISGQLVIVKDVAGTGVYWPEFGINTLQTLSPGKAYFVNMNGSAPLTFPGCDLKNNIMAYEVNDPETNPWNNPDRTPSSHVIAIPVSELNLGDIIGAFSSTGICCGLTEINKKDGFQSLVAFGNDPENAGQSILTEGEILEYRLFRPSVQNEYILDVTYDLNQPNREQFAEGGLSAIQFVSLSVPSSEMQLQPLVSVWPNPNHGSFNLKINNVTSEVEVTIMTSQGQLMIAETLESVDREISKDYDFLNLPKGMYILKVKSDGMLKVVRVVVN